MKCAIVFVIMCAALALAEEKYTTRFDNVNVRDILKNERLLKIYSNCLLNKGKCTPDAAELKKILPDALANGCTKCSQRQMQVSLEVLPHLVQNKPQLWAELEKAYDPSGSYKKKYCERAQRENINVGTACN